jgi:hypothetical protein
MQHGCPQISISYLQARLFALIWSKKGAASKRQALANGLLNYIKRTMQGCCLSLARTCRIVGF